METTINIYKSIINKTGLKRMPENLNFCFDSTSYAKSYERLCKFHASGRIGQISLEVYPNEWHRFHVWLIKDEQYFQFIVG